MGLIAHIAHIQKLLDVHSRMHHQMCCQLQVNSAQPFVPCLLIIAVHNNTKLQNTMMSAVLVEKERNTSCEIDKHFKVGK